MIQIVTTPKQSKQLLEIGIPAKTADLEYAFYDNNDNQITYKEYESNSNAGYAAIPRTTLNDFKPPYYPGWSLVALLTLIPHGYIIKTPQEQGVEYSCVAIFQNRLYHEEDPDIYNAMIKLLKQTLDSGFKLNYNTNE